MPNCQRAQAPRLVNLIGEHTDFNGGFVLPTAIPQRTRVEQRPLIARYFSYASSTDPAPFGWRLELPRRPWRDTAALAVEGGPVLEQMELWLDDRLVYAGPVGAINLGLDGVEPGDYLLLARVHDRRGATFERAERVTISAPRARSGRVGCVKSH